MNLQISQNLAAFKHVLMNMKNKEGKEILGIFIPIEANGIKKEEKDGKVSLWFNQVAFEMKEPKEFKNDKFTNVQTHIIKQSFSKEQQSKMSDEEKKSLPIFGNVSHGAGKSDDNSNPEPSKVFSPTDDLPF